MKGERGAPGSSGDEGDGLPRRCAPRSDRGKRKHVPHLFAKVTVIYCVAFASLASAWALWIADKDGLEVTGLLGVILGLFGGELLLLCLKTVLTKRKTPAQAGEKEEEV